MRCEEARPLISAAFDGEPVGFEQHVAGCADCARFREQLAMLRSALRVEPVDGAPDVAPRVLSALRERPPARRSRWFAAAATFVTAFAVGAAFIGLDPRRPMPAAMANLPARLLEAQEGLNSLTAAVTIIERGPASRVLTGELAYAAPESLALRLRDGDREFVSVIDEEHGWVTEGPSVLAVEGREPFSSALPAPLDVVLPVDGFRLDDAARPLSRSTIDGRPAVGVRVPAAQLSELLGGLQRAGQLRDIHPADEAELWLDERILVPLQLRVLPADTPERRLWASRRGYADPPGAAVLDVTLHEIEVNQGIPPESFPAAPPGIHERHAGFTPGEVDAPEPAWLPQGMRSYRTGVVTTPLGPRVEVRTWTDGRSWVRLRATEEWQEPRLFGDLGEAIRPVDLSAAGTGYVGAAGRLALHGDEVDIELEGSVAETDLLRIAASLPAVGKPVPADWAEAAVAALDEARTALPALLLPGREGRLEGFGPPSVHLRGDVVTLTYTGPGSRSVVLAQARGARLSPPLEPDVVGVEVRGRAGRYTPSLGALEWVENGLVISVRSTALTLEELLALTGPLS